MNVSNIICIEYAQIVSDKNRHGDQNLVRMNDVVFAVHGLGLSVFILLQTCIYKVVQVE